MLDALGVLDASLAALSFEVWQVPERLVQHDQHHWSAGVRLGPTASGTLTYKMKALLPGDASCWGRELPGVTSLPVQAEFPAPMDAEASLG